MNMVEMMSSYGFPSICLAVVAAYVAKTEEANRKERREDKEAERKLREELLETNKHILATSEDVAETNRLLATGIKEEVSAINNKLDVFVKLAGAPAGE